VDGYYHAPPGYTADARHPGPSVNVLWGDGHATSVVCKDRINPYGETGSYSAGYLDQEGITNIYDSPNHWTRDGRSLKQMADNP
jgi:prepilin-type processing-associated H-X9-DG protein